MPFFYIRPKKTAEFLRDAVDLRLRMLIPYIDTWPQVSATLKKLSQSWNLNFIIDQVRSSLSLFMCTLCTDRKWWMSCLYLSWLHRPWASCYCPTTSPTAWSTCPRWWMTSGTTQAIAQQTWGTPLIQNQHLLFSLSSPSSPYVYVMPPTYPHSASFLSLFKMRKNFDKSFA